jgi:hypothetical protein
MPRAVRRQQQKKKKKQKKKQKGAPASEHAAEFYEVKRVVDERDNHGVRECLVEWSQEGAACEWMPATDVITTHKPDPDAADSDSDSEDSDVEEYEVEALLKSRTLELDGSTTIQYLVKWVGYGADENTWEPEAGLGGATEKLQAFKKLRRTPEEVVDISALAESTAPTQRKKRKSPGSQPKGPIKRVRNTWITRDDDLPRGDRWEPTPGASWPRAVNLVLDKRGMRTMRDKGPYPMEQWAELLKRFGGKTADMTADTPYQPFEKMLETCRVALGLDDIDAAKDWMVLLRGALFDCKVAVHRESNRERPVIRGWAKKQRTYRSAIWFLFLL